jgi:hypothetical protein
MMLRQPVLAAGIVVLVKIVNTASIVQKTEVPAAYADKRTYFFLTSFFRLSN